MAYQVLSDKNIRSEFFRQLDIAERDSWANLIGFPTKSDRETETYKWLGSAPQMRKWVGSRHEKRVRVESYAITNEKFEATLELPLPEMERDNTGMLMVRAQELGAASGSHWEKLVNDLLEIADTSDGLCYDGQQFFDTDHVSGASGTQTNEVTATEIPGANVSTTTAPTAAELAVIFAEMVTHFYTYVDDQGEPINQNAKSFAIMVPPTATWGAAAGTAIVALNNPVVAANMSIAQALPGINLTLIRNPRIDWTIECAMFRMDGFLKPFILQTEVPMRTKMLGRGSEEEFKNDRHLMGVDARRGVGFGLWEHAMKVTLS